MKKKIVLGLLTLASISAAAGVASLTPNVAKANQTATVQTAGKTEFYLNTGAQVRFKEEEASGLRFTASVDESYIAGLGATEIKYCMILAPMANVENLADLTLDTIETYKGKAVHTTSAPSFTDENNANETFTYSGAVVYDMTDWTAEEIEQAYTTSLVARPYIVATKSTGNEVIYANIDLATERSMRSVVENAIEDLIEKNENAPKWSQAEFDSVLPYTVSKDVQAFHEQGGKVIIGTANSKGSVTEKDLAVSTNSLTLVDGASYAGQAVYVQGTETVGEETYVTLEKYGDITADSAGKNATATRADEAYDLPATALSATSNIFLFGTNGVISTSFTQITQVIDTFAEMQTAFDYSIYIPTWLEQGTKTGHYVLSNDINYVGTNVYAAINYATAASLQNNANIKEAWKTIGFNGIFDGLGHSLTVRTSGLFNGLLEGVQIRNVALKDILIHGDNQQHFSLLGSGAPVSGNEKKGSISNVYMSLASASYAKKVSILPTQAGWLEMENIVVDLDYSNAPTLAEGETATAGIYFSYFEYHQRGWNTAQYQNYATINNIQVFVKNYNEATVKYTFKWISSTNINADYTTYPADKYPKGHPFFNVLTEIGRYDSYAEFANGVAALDRNGEAFTITAEESLAKFTANEYWKVVTVEGDTTYQYPTWHK